ncbi:MAG: signal peptidase I, partial [Specibacter sp.]
VTAVATRRHGRHARGESKPGALWWLAQTASWLVLFTVAALAIVMVVLPRVSGGTAYTVLTGSMEPVMPPGTLAVVRPVDPATLRTGDVITYQIKAGEPDVVTHRVFGVGTTLGGELTVTTLGDANNLADPPVQPEQIRGRLWYSVPYLGYINTALTAKLRSGLLGVAAAALLGYAAIMAAGAARDHFRKRQP